MRKAVFVALCLGCVSVATDTEAATIFFNRASFNLANPTAATIALDGLVGTPTYPENYPFGTGYYSTDPAGLTVDGVDVLGTSFGAPETYILANDVAGGAFTLDGTDTLVGGRETTRFVLPTNVLAFGMDFGLLSGSLGPLAFTVYFRDNSTASWVLDVIQRSQFVGIRGTEIDRVVFDSGLSRQYSPYMLFDELTYASSEVVPTPEPASVGLLGIGLLGLGAAARRSKQA